MNRPIASWFLSAPSSRSLTTIEALTLLRRLRALSSSLRYSRSSPGYPRLPRDLKPFAANIIGGFLFWALDPVSGWIINT